MAHLGWVKDGHGDVGGVECRHNLSLISARGLANELKIGMRGDEGQEFAMARRGVGQFVITSCKVEVQRGLVNVEACVDNGGIVLTHTCTCELG